MTSDIIKEVPWLVAVSPDALRRIVDALYRVHRLIPAITDLDLLLEQIMQESKQVANAEACSLMLFDPRTEELYFSVALGEKGDQQALKREVRLRLNQGIAGVAAAGRKSVNVADVQQDTRFYRAADERSRFKTHSLLAVPLVDRDNLVGVLEVVNKVGGGAFTDTDLHIMEMFSSLAATAIANARLIEENLRAERLAAIGEAVAGLSHHTKNIITGMMGSVDLVQQGLERNSIELLQRSWPILQRSTRRISNFVEDMLAFSKPRRPVYESCNLAGLVEEVVQTLWSLLVRRTIELHLNLDKVAGPVIIDPRGIFRCLLNLLMNAADAVSSKDGEIWVTAHTADDHSLFIDVEDNGPGITDEHINKVFDPFFSTKGSRGTGLGLAVTRKIIQEHRGYISVARSPRGGAAFRIALPATHLPTTEKNDGEEEDPLV